MHGSNLESNSSSQNKVNPKRVPSDQTKTQFIKQFGVAKG